MQRQRGQSSTEYIVVTAALVLALLQDVSAASYGLLCPSGASRCNVMEMLLQTLKNRYEGYSYAISASEYPEPLISIPSPPSGPGGGTLPGGPGGGGSSTYTPPASMTAIGLDGKTVLGSIVNGVVYDEDGNVVGTVNDKGEVEDADGTVIGTVSAGTGGSGNGVAVDFIGTPIGKIDEYGHVVDIDSGMIVGKVDEDLDPLNPGHVYQAGLSTLILVSGTGKAGVIVDKTIGGEKVKVVVYDNGDPDGVIDSVVVVANIFNVNTRTGNLFDKNGIPLGSVLIIGQAGTIKGDKIVDEDGNVIGSI